MTRNILPLERPITEHRECALRQVPSVVSDYVQLAASRWGLGVAPLLAAALHHLCSIQAHRHRLREMHIGHSCPFNLIVCTQRPSQDRWFEYMGEAWMGVVRHNMRQHQAKGRERLEAEYRKLEQMRLLPVGMVGSPVPDQLDRQLFEVANQYKPCLVERRSGAAAALKALENSNDLCVLLTNGGMDPVEELLNSGRKPCLDLASLLNLSWSDIGLPGKSPVPTRGIVHLFWSTHASALRRLLLGLRSPWACNPPPVLLVRQHDPACLNELPVEDKTKAWDELLLKGLIQRLVLTEARAWSLSPEASQMMVGFRKQSLQDWNGAVDPLALPDFFPSLALRMAMLLSALELNTESLNDASLVSVSVMERACCLAQWMASEHRDCLRWLKNPHAGDVDDLLDDRGIDTIDLETLKQAIHEKLRVNGPLSPRDLSRSFHRLPRKARDLALAQLLKDGVIEELPDGRLRNALTAANVSVSGG